MKLHNFFSALLTHIGQTGCAADIVQALSPRSSPVQDGDFVNHFEEDLERLEDMQIESYYRGIHIKFPITTNVVHSMIESFKKKKLLHVKYVCLLLREATKLLKKSPTVSKASTAISKQITVVGDMHGKLDDLLTILYKNGLPSTDNPYVFNGDFVDRGKKSLEVVILLCALVLAFPAEVYLNRGNHEDMIMNARYGFCKEVNKKYKMHGPRVLRMLEEFYRWLPLATVIDNKVLVVHGGISEGTRIDKIARIDRSKYVSILRLPKAVLSEDEENYRNEDESPPFVRADEEWQQILDLLWSDPQSGEGCCPNVFRGGGSYFGPDVTKYVLEQHGYNLLIRSHECKLEGYEYMHGKQCLTIFSASNYYEAGSNRGAYVKLQGSDLEPYFVQYMADTTKRSHLTIRERVGRMESSAIRELKTQIIASKSALCQGFREFDPQDTGGITISEWVEVMETRSRLALPWRVLKDRLVITNTSTGKVNYMSTFSEDTLVRKSPLKAGPTVVEALYRHKNSLETIFRLIDRDNSGYISMEEFADACELISKHMETALPLEEINDLANSIDINKDGQIDFNEFLECFRIVDTVQANQNRIQKGEDFFDISMYGDEDDDIEDEDED